MKEEYKITSMLPASMAISMNNKLVQKMNKQINWQQVKI
jgi:hypothetical protein